MSASRLLGALAGKVQRDHLVNLVGTFVSVSFSSLPLTSSASFLVLTVQLASSSISKNSGFGFSSAGDVATTDLVLIDQNQGVKECKSSSTSKNSPDEVEALAIFKLLSGLVNYTYVLI
ncbi:hypothetical protein Taro_041231 [Colocasia esculenta]|uniref:Uncharacterized protein n=1 Tax=Colocasia esculenta TaxID=4460 RepID=A0A843WL21_COLES|nr:hypothetical protein [Colocasia esculenta]